MYVLCKYVYDVDFVDDLSSRTILEVTEIKKEFLLTMLDLNINWCLLGAGLYCPTGGAAIVCFKLFPWSLYLGMYVIEFQQKWYWAFAHIAGAH